MNRLAIIVLILIYRFQVLAKLRYSTRALFRFAGLPVEPVWPVQKGMLSILGV
jgi:hypothetical protein